MKTLKKITAIIVFTIVSATIAKAQLPYYIDEKTDEEHYITRHTEQETLNKYLEQNEFKAIEFNPDTGSVYSFRVQEKSGDWMLYNVSSIEFVFAPQKYSLDFPNSIFG